MIMYIKDSSFDGVFSGGDLVREVDTDRIFIFDYYQDRGCNYNSTFERVIEVRSGIDRETTGRDVMFRRESDINDL